MDYYKRRKLVIVGGVVCAVLFLGLAIWLGSKGGQSAKTTGPTIQVTKDPDTGDEIVKVPGKSDEYTPPDQSSVFVLGATAILDKTPITDQQYQLLTDTLQAYATDHVASTATTIKFLPETIKADPAGQDSNYTFQVKTVNPEHILNVNLRIIGFYQIQLTVTDTTKPNGTYDSGVLPPDNQEPIDYGADADN